MRFIDAVLTSGILLPALAGIRNITGVFTVGRAGYGAQYTSVQDALDAIPDSSSATAPSIVLIFPGIYTENVTLQKDGVHLVGLGGVKILNDGASHTLTISASLDTTPLKVVIQGLEIENDQAAYSCIKMDGADSFATGTVTCNTAPLAAGDTLTIGGTVLTGVATARISGSDNFSTLGSTVAAIAAEVAAALNDSANSFADTILATPAADVITIDAVTAGSGGNAITLASSTTPAGGFTESGATLTGGSAAGSLVLSQGLLLLDCILLATGAGTYQINADTCNDIWIRGGTWRGSSATSVARVADCSSLRVFGVEWTNDFDLGYDTGNDEPANAATAYSLQNCGTVGDLVVALESGGSLVLQQNPVVGDLTMGGTQSVSAVACGLGDVALDDTVAATLSRTRRGTITLTGGTPTLAESMVFGSETFTAETSVTVTFAVDQPDTSYTVLLESPDTGVVLGLANKATTGFDIEATPALTGTVNYTVVRNV